MHGAQARPPSILEKLSYVLASRQRESVLAAVIPGPKTPVQVSHHTGLRLPHVSRTLGQLVRTDLVHRVAGERRGKLYAASSLGLAVFDQLADARGDRLIAPMVRGSHFRSYHHWVAQHHGRTAADEVLIEVGLDPYRLDGDAWYTLRSAMEVLDQIERRFGDGTYNTIRRMLYDEAQYFPSVKRLISRVLPLPILLELSPNAYAREFNHGRLEVEAQDHHAILKNYDWLSSPARCAAWLGTYEGLLSVIGIEGRVTKVACMLRGDPYCGYEIEW